MADKLLTKTREKIDEYGDEFDIGASVDATESAYNNGSSGLIIGHCKAMIESISKSILDEKSISYEPNSNTSWLAKRTIQALGVAEGVGNENKARGAFSKLVASIANNFETAEQGISELRNDFCTLSHGRSTSHEPLDMFYAEFVARQTDAMIGFIYDLYMNQKTLESSIIYQENEEFNDYLNDEYGSIQIYGDTYPLSLIPFPNPTSLA